MTKKGPAHFFAALQPVTRKEIMSEKRSPAHRELLAYLNNELKKRKRTLPK